MKLSESIERFEDFTEVPRNPLKFFEFFLSFVNISGVPWTYLKFQGLYWKSVNLSEVPLTFVKFWGFTCSFLNFSEFRGSLQISRNFSEIREGYLMVYGTPLLLSNFTQVFETSLKFTGIRFSQFSGFHRRSFNCTVIQRKSLMSLKFYWRYWSYHVILGTFLIFYGFFKSFLGCI